MDQMFSQADVNRIVSSRLNEDRAKRGRATVIDAAWFSRIVDKLSAHADAKQAYQQAVSKLDADKTYSDDYKDEMKRLHREKYEGGIPKSRAAVMQAIRDLRKHAEQRAESFDVGDEKIHQALLMIQASGGNMSPSARRGIVEVFRGNLNALSLMKGAFDAQGVYEPLLGELNFRPSEKFAELEAMVHRSYQFDGSIATVAEEVAAIGKLYGLDVALPYMQESGTNVAATKYGLI